MTIEQTIKDLNVFAQHENAAIAGFTKRAVGYAQALKAGEISAEEYRDLMGDIDTLRAMASTADEEKTVTRIFQIAMLIPSLV